MAELDEYCREQKIQAESIGGDAAEVETKVQMLKDQLFQDQNFKIEYLHYMNSKADLINIVFGRKGKYLFIEYFDKNYILKYEKWIKDRKDLEELDRLR